MIQEVDRRDYLAGKVIAEQSMWAFLVLSWQAIYPDQTYQDGRHIHALCHHLEWVDQGLIRRLLVNVPYRTSKSTIVSIAWPAWTWTRRPSFKWLCLSHAERLAMRDTRAMRQLCMSDWFQRRWPMTFAADQNQKKLFENDSYGRRLALGIGSDMTGEGGDGILIDDPHDRDKAHSEKGRQGVCESYDEKISSRLNNLARDPIVIIGQRLHEADLFGHLLKRGGWDHLCIPMEYESDHPYKSTRWTDWRTVDGQLMWEERFPRSVVEQEKSKSTYAAAGQLQQRPAPRDGGIFRVKCFQDNWVDAEDVPDGTDVRAWDLAATAGAGDYTVGVKMRRGKDKNYYVMDVVRGRWEPDERDAMILATAQKDGKKVAIYLEQEGGSGGKAQAHYLVRKLIGYRVDSKSMSGKGGKEFRAGPLASQMAVGAVRIVRGAWNDAFQGELMMFPNGANDDQVDAAASAFEELFDRPSFGMGKAGEGKSDREQELAAKFEGRISDALKRAKF